MDVMYGYGAEPSTSLLKSVFYQVYSLQRRESSKSYVTLCNAVGITRCMGPCHSTIKTVRKYYLSLSPRQRVVEVAEELRTVREDEKQKRHTFTSLHRHHFLTSLFPQLSHRLPDATVTSHMINTLSRPPHLFIDSTAVFYSSPAYFFLIRPRNVLLGEIALFHCC